MAVVKVLWPQLTAYALLKCTFAKDKHPQGLPLCEKRLHV